MTPGFADPTRLRELTEAASCDALVASAPENVTYATRAAPFLMYAFPPGNPYKEETLAVVRADGASALVASAEAAPYLAERGATADRFLFHGDPGIAHAVEAVLGEATGSRVRNASFFASAFDALVAALDELDLAQGSLGVDSIGLFGHRLAELRDRLPRASLRNGTEVFRSLRAVKTVDEVAVLETVLDIVERAMADAFDALAPGITELEVERIVRERIAGEGAQPGHYETASGPRASAPFPPSAYAVQPGDVVRSDCGARLDGYWADTGRSAVVGEGPAVLERAYEALRAGIATMMDGVRPGASAGEVAEAGIEAVRTNGVPGYERPHAGHGIGLELYERPLLRPGETTRLEAGMVVNVELPYSVLGVGGLQIEETLLVSAEGCTVLTSAPRELRRVGTATTT